MKLSVRAYAATVVVVILIGFGLATSTPDPHEDSARHPLVAAAAELFPSDTAQDWVTYGDHLIQGNLQSEIEIAPSQDELQANEGIISRGLTLTVDRVLWSRKGAPPLPPRLQWEVPGWAFQGNERREFFIAGSPRIEKGHTYLLQVVHLAPSETVGDGGWSPLAAATTFSYDNGKIGDGEMSPDGGHRRSAIARAVWGKSESALVALLENARPEPAAAKFMGLDPQARLRAVQEAPSSYPPWVKGTR